MTREEKIAALIDEKCDCIDIDDLIILYENTLRESFELMSDEELDEEYDFYIGLEEEFGE